MTFFLGFSPPETTREGGGRRGTLAVTHSLNFYQDELDPAKHTKERWWKGKKSWTSKNCRRQQFIIKVSSWRFYNRQEEVLDQKSPKVIDRFVFNYLAVDNVGPGTRVKQQIASTHIQAAWFFLSFFWRAKPTSRWEMILLRTSQ